MLPNYVLGTSRSVVSGYGTTANVKLNQLFTDPPDVEKLANISNISRTSYSISVSNRTRAKYFGRKLLSLFRVSRQLAVLSSEISLSQFESPSKLLFDGYSKVARGLFREQDNSDDCKMRDIPTRPFGRDSLRNFVKRNLIGLRKLL